MMTVLRFIFLLPLAFVVSCGTSAFALLWPYFERGADGRLIDPVYLFQWAIAYFAQAAQIGSTLLLPWAIFMAVTEIAGLSFLVFHLVAGLVGSIAVIFLAYREGAPSGGVQAAIVVSGLVFALTYWLIAGRSAGSWRQTTRRSKRDRMEGAAPPPPKRYAAPAPQNSTTTMPPADG
ncbi:MAG: hypothetical protein VYD57_15700 [Pseudomonadota bacterium]|nr:hypothetical protein [Pseudomonadota bacterium]